MVMKPCLHPTGDETLDKFSFMIKERKPLDINCSVRQMARPRASYVIFVYTNRHNLRVIYGCVL